MEYGVLSGAVNVEIKQYVWDTVDSNSWLLIENNKGFLVDAIDSEELYASIRKLDELYIVLTHSHFDHITGLNHIRSIKPDCRVISTELCSEHVGNKYRNMSASATAFMTFYNKGKTPTTIESFECAPADKVFKNTLDMMWYGHKIEMYAVYGHTNDSLLVVIDKKLLFTGDTLLHNPTITRFPTGNKELFINFDLPLLNQIEAEKVYPGHGKIGSLAEMLACQKI